MSTNQSEPESANLSYLDVEGADLFSVSGILAEKGLRIITADVRGNAGWRLTVAPLTPGPRFDRYGNAVKKRGANPLAHPSSVAPRIDPPMATPIQPPLPGSLN